MYYARSDGIMSNKRQNSYLSGVQKRCAKVRITKKNGFVMMRRRVTTRNRSS